MRKERVKWGLDRVEGLWGGMWGEEEWRRVLWCAV